MTGNRATLPGAAGGAVVPSRLRGSRERVSGSCVFPAVPETSPAAVRYEPISLSEQATLYSYTVIHPSPKRGEQPFIVVYADFPEQVRVFGRLWLPEGAVARIGMALRVVAPQTHDGPPGTDQYAFVPAGEVAT